jgi:ornithine cyclodeaminase/alanine dehydrogenase-like protein (mu-crystallin family)
MSTSLPPLRYLGAADVRAAMPPIEERLRLAELTMTALVADAELPPKIGVHPRPPDSFAHAMPAFLRGRDGSGTGDGLGMKWVTGFPGNVARGLPGIHAVVLLNDASSGIPIALMDGGPITAERTAAVTGVAIRRFAPRFDGRPATVGLIGAGVQGRSHLPVIGHLLPGCRLRVFDRDAARATALATQASATAGIAAAEAVPGARDATAAADVVVTAAAFGPVRQVMTDDWLAPGILVVAVDYATYAAAEVARDASLFVVDERAQFLANRDAGLFDGYPDPDMTLGEAILAGTGRPEGRVVVTHLGVGLADVIFARAILEAATERDIGTELAR